jgi:hypothetical protein
MPKVQLPSSGRQKERLEKKFKDVVEAFDDMKPDVEGFEPERVIVFETVADSVTEFAKAAAKVEGLEWVGDLDLGDEAGNEDFHVAEEGDEAKPLTARLYAVMSNQKAIQELLSLWEKWQADPDKEWTTKGYRGFGPFKNVFQHLKDIRRWGPTDRLQGTGVLAAWQEEQQFAADHPNIQHPPVRFEVELWYRGNDAARAKAFTHLNALVTKVGGQCITQGAIGEIYYHGVLAELPAPVVGQTLAAIQSQTYTDLLRCDDVMFFRPRAQALFRLMPPGEEKVPAAQPPGPIAHQSPVIAVLDGLPLENHTLLRDRLRIDDPEQFRQHYTQPDHQQHGTAICSLILNGDLNKNEPPLSQKLYVRPIYEPKTDFDGKYVDEGTPDNVLLIDLFHRTIRRIVEADGNQPAAAPTVKVINLSFGNRWQPFETRFSPLARLLDWLAWKYRLLFLVSVGNHGRDITIGTAANKWKTLSPEELRAEVVRAVRDDQAYRRPLSPAESVNAVTVGAWHEDACHPLADNRVDLYKDSSLPCPFGTHAAGYDQAVKPEVYLPGGRQLYRGPVVEDDKPTKFTPVYTNRAPGLKVAAPGTNPADLTGVCYSRGTSDATALATRSVGLAYERLMEYRKLPGWERLTDDYLPVILKALLVHGASWGPEADLIEAAIPPDDLKGKNGHRDWQRLQRILNRFIGCGKVDPLKVQFATDQRATVLAWDTLPDGKSHLYALPLPPSLGGKQVKRRLTLTLAWLTPVNARHKNYRQAFLWTDVGLVETTTFEVGGKKKKKRTEKSGKETLLVKKAGLDEKTSQRGTVQHGVWESEEKAVVIPEGERILIRVNCKADAGKMTDSIPYALAVSLEVAEGLDIPIYQEVKNLILVPIAPAPNAG